MNLPNPCEKCAPFNGAWVETETGLKRCECARGQALKAARAAAQNPPVRPPVLNAQQQTMFAEILAALKFYPSEAGARSMIGSEIASMCNSDEEAHWLVREMVRRYKEWPGILEMRAVFCDRKEPRDGVCAISPAVEQLREAEQTKEMLALPAPTMRQLAAGEPVSAAQSIVDVIKAMAPKKDLNRIGLPSPSVPDIPVQRVTAANAITQADIDRAVEEARAAKRRALDELAKAEMGESCEVPVETR